MLKWDVRFAQFHKSKSAFLKCVAPDVQRIIDTLRKLSAVTFAVVPNAIYLCELINEMYFKESLEICRRNLRTRTAPDVSWPYVTYQKLSFLSLQLY